MVQTIFQCPLLGGNAVFKARGMYAMINDTLKFDDVNICLQNGIVLREQNTSSSNTASETIYLVPNPAKQNVKLYYQFSSEQSGDLLISNSYGQVVLKRTLNANENELSIFTGNLADGIYFVKVISDGMVIGNGKLVIIK